LALPPELLRTIDRFAVQERRSRANMIEIILDDYTQARLAKEAA
jgi:metal-responsive CopG/Arc/MetJ family transcriptional regulator